MECNTSEFHCLNLTSQDLSQLESISEAYFGAREFEEEEEEVNSASEDSSSDDEDNIDLQVEEDVEVLEDDQTERDKVQHFYTETCKCKLGSEDKACSTTLTQDEFIESRNNCYELSSTELDLVILGIIQSSLNSNGTSISGRVAKDRKHPRMTYFYHGKRISLFALPK